MVSPPGGLDVGGLALQAFYGDRRHQPRFEPGPQHAGHHMTPFVMFFSNPKVFHHKRERANKT